MRRKGIELIERENKSEGKGVLMSFLSAARHRYIGSVIFELMVRKEGEKIHEPFL